MKVLLTGTHFTPAQASVEELRKWPDVELIYIGRNHTMEGDSTTSVESSVLPKLGVKFLPITAGRIRRDFSIYTLSSLLKIPIGFIQAFVCLLKEDPDIVVSFGGYVGVPVVLSAWLLSKPIVIHEQTLVPGLANKVSSLFADKIAVSFRGKYSYPKEKIVLTGNPLRGEILSALVSRKITNKIPSILILGGNQGSLAINKAVFGCLDELTQLGEVIHQTGQSKLNNFDQALETKRKIKNPSRYKLFKWIDDKSLARIYRQTDLVISRAGINTLAEIALFKVPSVVIPLPIKEQLFNAQYFAQISHSRILKQENLTPLTLLEAVEEILKRRKLKREQESESPIIKDGSKRLSQEIMILGKDL